MVVVGVCEAMVKPLSDEKLSWPPTVIALPLARLV